MYEKKSFQQKWKRTHRKVPISENEEEVKDRNQTNVEV